MCVWFVDLWHEIIRWRTSVNNKEEKAIINKKKVNYKLRFSDFNHLKKKGKKKKWVNQILTHFLSTT